MMPPIVGKLKIMTLKGNVSPGKKMIKATAGKLRIMTESRDAWHLSSSLIIRWYLRLSKDFVNFCLASFTKSLLSLTITSVSAGLSKGSAIVGW